MTEEQKTEQPKNSVQETEKVFWESEDIKKGEASKYVSTRWPRTSAYTLLGISEQDFVGKTDEEADKIVKKSYHKKGKEIHPDVQKGEISPDQERINNIKITLLNEAYSRLNTPINRQWYSQYGYKVPRSVINAYTEKIALDKIPGSASWTKMTEAENEGKGPLSRWHPGLSYFDKSMASIMGSVSLKDMPLKTKVQWKQALRKWDEEKIKSDASEVCICKNPIPPRFTDTYSIPGECIVCHKPIIKKSGQPGVTEIR